MKLIIGIGNPGLQYQYTRHNIGFLLIDHIALYFGASAWQPKDKFKALIAEVTYGAEKVIFAKPTTFYNLSGESVRSIIDFYKLSAAQDVLVIHDELALPFGTLRTRLSGSDAGNNGIKNIISHAGSAFARIRVGISSDHALRYDSADFVLGQFTQDEQKRIPIIADHATTFAKDFIHQERAFAPTSVRLP